jgi:chorismate mutase
MKKPDTDSAVIQAIRKQIDIVDNQLIHLLFKRFKLSKEMGILKNKSGISIIDSGRERQIFDRLLRKTQGSLIDRQLILGIWKNIIKKSYQIQRQVYDGKKNRTD